MNKRVILSILAVSALANAKTNLEAITVTASDRFDTTLSNTTANVTVITSDEIEQKGYTTVEEAISHISGITVAQSGGAGQTTSVFMRGFNKGNIKFLINGIPLQDPSDISFSFGTEHIPVSNIDRIEVIKGAQSGLWGADACWGYQYCNKE